MTIKRLIEYWKYPTILLFGIGISNIGSWIYFIALNLMVLSMTESPLAVAALYILRPLATLLTNLWSGSFIDRLNKRSLMFFLDLFRAILIAALPFFTSIWYIYSLVLFINMANSVFGPTAMIYITKLIPIDQRQRFNSLNSLIGSGAFLIGPAVTGILFYIGSPVFAIYINAIALFISAMITLFMPNLEKHTQVDRLKTKMSINIVKKDLGIVFEFYRSYFYVMIICFLFGSVMIVMASAVDSLEAPFALFVLHLTESEYGILVSIAGAGIIVGAIINTIIVKKIVTSIMIGAGTIGMCFGYIIYAFSFSFFVAAIGFFVLAFFLAFANTGFTTFYQNNIPTELMGRVGSFNEFIQAILIIITTAILGIASEYSSIQFVVISAVLVMFLLGVTLCAFIFQPSKLIYFQLKSPH